MGAAVGVTGDFFERAQELVKPKVDVLVVDTAHGHSQRVMDAVRRLRNAAARTWNWWPATSRRLKARAI